VAARAEAKRASGALTARQVQILDLVARGRRTRDVAKALGISERAVTAHITRLMEKFGVENRPGLIAAALISNSLPITVGMLRDADLRRYRHAPFLVAVTIGPTHVFRFVNDMWERVMRLRGADVLGRTVRQVFPGASPVTYAARQRAFRESRPTTGNAWHYRWTSAEGSQREADFRYLYQPLRDGAGVVRGLLLIATETHNGDPN